MSDKKLPNLPLDSDDDAEKKLWDALGKFDAEEPSANLRRGFYRELEDANRPTAMTKLRDLLGISSNTGWLTAAACLLVGLGAGQLLEDTSGDDTGRLAALEQNVSVLNRTLILDRLDNDSAGKRLRGVIDAAYFAADDAEITRALLQRATEDRVHSVRAAAIDALGPQIGTPSIGSTIMESIQQAGSPLVQLALIDLVLRNGNAQQINQLLKLAEDGKLYPDLSRHVLTSLKRDTA